AGRIETLSINLPSGSLLPSSLLTSIARPADLWLSIDGRSAYVLDQQTARVVAFRIDTLSGGLIALGSATNLVGSPTRLVSAQPFDLLHIFPGLTMLALDPLTRQALPIDVDPKTGLLTATLNYVADLPLGTQSIGVVEGVGFNDVLLSASDDGASGQLASFQRDDTAQVWVPVDTVALGRGPLAIAKRPRLVAP
ncbi:MAG TPA: hypothetical protein VK843_13455, partial [Planctomycetota bacterium]|nr:hypothetical protein [Planctomycetota bacterium]